MLERVGTSNDMLVISLYDNGDMSYTQPLISSYIPFDGKWSIEDGRLVLRDGGYINYFDMVDGNLVFVKEGSSGFGFFNIPDGAVFTRQYDISGY